jgi:hypothetical protein
LGLETCRAARRFAPVECAPPLPRPHLWLLVDGDKRPEAARGDMANARLWGLDSSVDN